MAYGFHRTKVTYELGWLSAIAAFLYKAVNIAWSDRISRATGIWPVNFLQASIILFLITIASAQYASTYLRHELPKYEAEERPAPEDDD